MNRLVVAHVCKSRIFRFPFVLQGSICNLEAFDLGVCRILQHFLFILSITSGNGSLWVEFSGSGRPLKERNTTRMHKAVLYAMRSVFTI